MEHQSTQPGLTVNERKAVTRQLAPRYQRATTKQRKAILNELTALTDYNRSSAAFVLRNWGRKRILTIGGVRTIYVFGQHRRQRAPKQHKRTYDPERIMPSLKYFWVLSGGLCGKRLAPFIRSTLPVLRNRLLSHCEENNCSTRFFHVATIALTSRSFCDARGAF